MRPWLTLLILLSSILISNVCHCAPCPVLLVENTTSADSVAVASYYALMRHIPESNICRISCGCDEECSTVDGEATIIFPVRSFIHQHDLPVDYIVLTKGIPIRFSDGQFQTLSVDSVMTEIDTAPLIHILNPYFGATDKFSHKEYGIYLVTRLTGWTVADCKQLIDSGLADRPGPGPIYLHPAFDKNSAAYLSTNQAIRNAGSELEDDGVAVYLDQTDYFHQAPLPLMGYYSWGSNDSNFDKTMYRSTRFAPGAIADTVVSTSGRTFDNPNDDGQSLIADLIHQGVAGCKGYVAEPFVDAVSYADLLFGHYTKGYNLAESFYAASRFLGWRDTVIGDPLCAPYAKQNGL